MEETIDSKIEDLKIFGQHIGVNSIDVLIDKNWMALVEYDSFKDSVERREILKQLTQEEFIKINEKNDFGDYLKLYDYDTHYAIAFVDPMNNNLLEIGVIPPMDISPRPKDDLEQVHLSYRYNTVEVYESFKDAIEVFTDNAKEFKQHLDNFKKPAYENIEEVKIQASNKSKYRM